MGSGSSKGAPASSGGEAKKEKNGNAKGRNLLRLSCSSCFRGFAEPPPPPRRVKFSNGQETASWPSLAHIAKSDEEAPVVPKSHPEGIRVPSSGSDRDQNDDVLQNATGISTTAENSHLPNPPDRSRPCFGVNFELSTAASLESSVTCSVLSSGLSTSANPVGGCGISEHSFDGDISLQGGASASGIDSTRDTLRDNSITAQARVAHQARTNLLECEDANFRPSYRRIGSQEHCEGSVRFSRTRSVGRLRDRVLRRTPISDGLFDPSLLYDRTVWLSGNTSARQGSAIMQRTNSNRSSEELPHPLTNSMHNSTPATLREASNQDLLERRSAFVERRRRIRSQVRALQRLGSRFENLSGHERTCILSGQHRTENCNCRTSSGPGNSDEETGTRASISRIVMLAEALFEVLDEIHQQSSALSSRPSFSSTGSVPAPKEIVECLPVKVYTKALKQQPDEAPQCYICLVEYEEEDCVRILPCNHEFHLTCVDKWLKEIHRVCPLCRGDVCRSDTSRIQKFS